MGHLFFESGEDFHQTFDPYPKSIMADHPNFTNAQSMIQVSEVMVNARRSETGTLRLHKSDLG